ncbi:MAG: response regulator [Limnobacter sp.]|nr:response regulator [Limnobacter sp.]
MEHAERHLLLVDDEENVLRSLQRLLRKDGYTLYLANSAQRAFEILAEQPIDVIVSDQRMPEQTGTEFLSKVKEKYPRTVRLMLSGYTEVSSVTDAINEGAIYKFLTKPWDDGQLRANIREAFQRHAMETENIRLHVEIEEINTELLSLNHVLEQQLLDRNQRIDRDISVVSVMQEMIDNLPLGVIGLDSAAEVISMNNWVANLLGSAVASYTGQSVTLLPDPFPELIHDYLFSSEMNTQRHFATVGNVQVTLDIKPMGLSSDSSGCLVIVQPR